MSQANSISDIERAEHLNYADNKGVKRVSIFNDGNQINSSTEETSLGIKTDIEIGNNTLDQINSKTQLFTITESISTNSFDINAAPFSSTTNIVVDYKLDSIEIHFSTSQTKTITVTSSKGTIIYTDNNTLTDIFLNNLNLPFKANENFTITVTQTAGACLMNLYARTITGTATVLGTTQLVDYDMEVDDTGTYYYIGKASVGSATSSAVWQIFRFDSLGNKRFADNTSNYSKVWDNRASYTYLN